MMKTLLKSLPAALLILLYVYAAISKLVTFDDFRGQLYNQSFPREVAVLLLYLLPAAELLTAGLLFFPRTERTGLTLSLVLLTLFTGYISLVLLHFWSRVPCSCGGVLSHLSWGGHLLFNLFFIALNLIALYRRDAGATRPA
jgi:putative oxidoreductase